MELAFDTSPRGVFAPHAQPQHLDYTIRVHPCSSAVLFQTTDKLSGVSFQLAMSLRIYVASND